MDAALVADQRVEHAMESGIPAGDIGQALRLDRVYGAPHDLFEFPKLLFGQSVAYDAEGIPLQDGSQVDKLLRFRLRVAGGREAPRRERRDQPFQLEFVEGLTDGGPADAEISGQPLFG